jgi:hypothetical protein
MIEIRNKKKYPVQLPIRSTRKPRQLTTLNIPGVGRGKNIYLLEDERETEYIKRAEEDGLISTRHIPNTITKGE